MRILVINPNTTAAMTDTLVAEVTRHAPAGTIVDGMTAAFGAPVIATRESFAVGADATLDAFARYTGTPDAIILGCFGDPGLAALRARTAVPVTGLAEASFLAADVPFAVLTSGAAWRDILLEQIALSPNAALGRGVWTLDATGLDVRRDPDAFIAQFDDLGRQALAAGAEALILGGAVLAGYAPRLRAGVRYIDCVAAAVAAISPAPCPAGG